MMPVTLFTFIGIGGSIANRRFNPGSFEDMHHFRSLFGISPATCSMLWHRLQAHRPARAQPKHLMWALLFLKVYGTEAALSSMTRSTRKTYRKWVRKMLRSISLLAPVVVGMIAPDSSLERFTSNSPSMLPSLCRSGGPIDSDKTEERHVRSLSTAPTFVSTSHIRSTECGTLISSKVQDCATR